MTECEKGIVNLLIENNIVKFYIKYLDDTLLVLRKKDIDINKNLQSVLLKVECPIFSTLEFVPMDLVYIIKIPKLVNTEILITSWIISFTIRTKQMCWRNYLHQEINLIKNYASWNAFPKRIANSTTKQASQTNDSNITRSKKANVDSIKIFLNLNYSGETAERMVKSCIKKLYKIFKRETNVKFITHYETTKMSFFRNIKNKTRSLSQSSVA